MAATAITNTVLVRNTVATFPATAASDATDGVLITCDKDDQKMLIIIENVDASNAETVTILKGDGLQGVSNLAVSVPASSMRCVVVESGRFKNVSGTLKGKIKITGTADVKIACVVLP